MQDNMRRHWCILWIKDINGLWINQHSKMFLNLRSTFHERRFIQNGTSNKPNQYCFGYFCSYMQFYFVLGVTFKMLNDMISSLDYEDILLWKAFDKSIFELKMSYHFTQKMVWSYILKESLLTLFYYHEWCWDDNVN